MNAPMYTNLLKKLIKPWQFSSGSELKKYIKLTKNKNAIDVDFITIVKALIYKSGN